MVMKKPSKSRFVKAIFGCFLGILSIISPVMIGNNAFADEEDGNASTTVQTTETEEAKVETRTCDDTLGSIGWLVCPTTGKISEAVDWLYDKNKELLEINPLKAEEESPIYQIWKYCLGIANIAFVIFLLIAIYSQITGVGISNYGIKKALPKLIIAAIMVNLSFLVCSLAVDLSNIIGNGVRGIFTSVEESTVPLILSEEGYATEETSIKMSEMYSSLSGGTALAIGGGVIAFEGGEIWMLIPAVLGALVAVVVGLITIALRQVVVVLLVMIAPLAIVSYILPNTEHLFKKWKDLLTKMLVFYPMYSLLFGASSLAGWAIIASASNGFMMILGVAVQIFPLFFSWSLMKMSGTFLGTINAKITGFFAVPLATNRAWAESRKAETSAYYLQYGKTPYSHLRRYLSNRKELREQNTANLLKIRKNEANIYAQKKISGGYDGTKAEGTSDFLKANKYTHAAKDAANTSLASETATKDTTHVLSAYGSYFTSEEIRNRVKAANKIKDAKELERLSRIDEEQARAAIGAKNYLELSRAQMTAENDEEADFKFMVSEFVDANMNRDKLGMMPKYRHYIESSAGELGLMGTGRVMGKIIARAAAVENSQRRDDAILLAKYPIDKHQFRAMVVGYHTDDDGYAIDKNGKVIEKVRGELLVRDPGKLWLWDKVDENGEAYFDWYDGDTFVQRVYRNDKSMVKEILSNIDAPINDPINNNYAFLAGINKGNLIPSTGDPEKDKLLKNIGLDDYRTTVGRALLSAPFKEKNAAFSPMVAEMVKRGYIKNYAQLNLAYLDSLNKATKPGAFNTQDGDAIDLMAMMMDPDQWNKAFPEDLIRGYRNVNGKPLIVKKEVLENGELVLKEFPATDTENVSYEDLMERVKEKFIFPAARKITMMMSRQTPNTADNQKAGAAEKWKNLKKVFDTKWGVGRGQANIDPYLQSGDMRKIARGVQQQIHTPEFSGVNHAEVVESLHINSGNDPDKFASEFMEYCGQHSELARVAEAFDAYISGQSGRGRFPTEDELHDFAVDALNSFLID